MSNELKSVVISSKLDGSWMAEHIPSGKKTHGLNKDEALEAMYAVLGAQEQGDKFSEQLTSTLFAGDAYDVAVFLEQDVSRHLNDHDGFARLDEFKNNIAYVRLGGGCKGCPASEMTLSQGVLKMLQDKFGEETVIDIVSV